MSIELNQSIAADMEQREEIRTTLETLTSPDAAYAYCPPAGADDDDQPTYLLLSLEFASSRGRACRFTIFSSNGISWTQTDKSAIHCWLEAATRNPNLTSVVIQNERPFEDKDKDMIATVFEAIQKIRLVLYMDQNDFIFLLGVVPGDWIGLEILHLNIMDNDSFLTLINCMVERELSGMKSLSLTNETKISALDGIGLYLAQKAPNSLETLSLYLQDATGNAIEKIVLGLLQNTTITDFCFHVEIIEDHGANALGELLRTTSTLAIVELSILQEHGSYFQNVVFEAMSTNTSIRRLVLHSGLYDLSCEHQLGTMLLENNHLEDVWVCICPFQDTRFEYGWFQATATGLRVNSTLRRLRVGVYKADSDVALVGPLFDSQTSAASNLRSLFIDSKAMSTGDAQRFADMVQNPNCSVTNVRINCFRDTDLAPIFTACQRNATLLLLQICYCDSKVDRSAWETIASTIPQLNLIGLRVVNTEPGHGIDNEIQESLLDGLDRNQCIEQFDMQITKSDGDFQKKILNSCHKNRIRKVSEALSSHVLSFNIPNHPPLSTRNRFLLQVLSGELEKQLSLRRSVFYAFLRRHRLDTESWKRVQVLVMKSALGKRKRDNNSSKTV